MSNVKPGDLARFIADPDDEGLIGCQVMVIAEPTMATVGFSGMLMCDMMAVKWNSQIWAVQMLETRATSQTVFKAGEIVGAVDRFLKRIDPPAGDEDLWRDQPIESDNHKPNVKEKSCQ